MGERLRMDAPYSTGPALREFSDPLALEDWCNNLKCQSRYQARPLPPNHCDLF